MSNSSPQCDVALKLFASGRTRKGQSHCAPLCETAKCRAHIRRCTAPQLASGSLTAWWMFHPTYIYGARLSTRRIICMMTNMTYWNGGTVVEGKNHANLLLGKEFASSLPPACHVRPYARPISVGRLYWSCCQDETHGFQNFDGWSSIVTDISVTFGKLFYRQ